MLGVDIVFQVGWAGRVNYWFWKLNNWTFKNCHKNLLCCDTEEVHYQTKQMLQIKVVRGVAWSSGQHRSMLLQGLRVHIQAIPSFFAVVTATMLRWQPKRFNYGSGTPQARHVGPEWRREWGNKMDWPAGESGMKNMQKEDGSLRKRLNG